ncbi:MAG: lysostaphin resistance A-like protein [Clostridium sp.]|uniref:CPBP family intramembrane glutamic endopeptidase n=1 Tax=Clostridium sp. TaxID=1506 RepID=UPI003F2E90CD
MNKILKTIGFLVVLYIVYNLITTIVVGAFGFAYSVQHGLTKVTAKEITDYVVANSYLISLISNVIFIIALLIKRGSIMKCRFKKVEKKDFLYIAMLSFGLTVVLCMVAGILSTIFTSYNEVQNMLVSTKTSIWGLVTVIILIPICEEIIFRGVIFGYLRDRYKLPIAVGVQALIFALMHGNMVQGIYTFILGLVLGLIYVYTDSLYGSILVHIIYNLFGVLVLNELYTAFPISVYICIVLALVCIAFAGTKITKKFGLRLNRNI